MKSICTITTNGLPPLSLLPDVGFLVPTYRQDITCEIARTVVGLPGGLCGFPGFWFFSLLVNKFHLCLNLFSFLFTFGWEWVFCSPDAPHVLMFCCSSDFRSFSVTAKRRYTLIAKLSKCHITTLGFQLLKYYTIQGVNCVFNASFLILPFWSNSYDLLAQNVVVHWWTDLYFRFDGEHDYKNHWPMNWVFLQIHKRF